MSKGNPKTANIVIEWSPRGVTTFDNITKTTRQYGSVHEAAASLSTKSVLVAASRRVVFIRTTRVPDASASDVRLVLSMRLGELFPIPASELSYDFMLTDNVDSDGRLAIVAAMSAQDLRRLHDEFKSAGLRVEGVVPVAFGSALLIESLGRTNGAIVSQDDEGIGIDIVEGRQLRYSRISSNVSSPAAEVCRTYTVAGMPCGEMIGAGGFHFQDADFVSKSTSLESLVSGGHAITTINLELPEVVALRTKKAREGRQRIALVAFIAALGACAYAYTGYSAASAQVDAADSLAQSAIAKLTKQKDAVTADQTAAGSALDAIDLAFKYGQKYSDIATIVADDAPPNVWLGGLSLERGKRLVFRGVAMNYDQVNEYADKLGTEPRLRNVRLEFANDGAIDQKPVVQFSISAFPVGNVPLYDPTQMRKK